MNSPRRSTTIESIEVELIDVLNPRSRNEAVYKAIEANIATVGLKKPITVSPRVIGGATRYLLVCGEGRLRAYKALGQSKIPAQLLDVSDEDAFVMSLAENMARRHYKPLELFSSISRLRDKGLNAAEISRITGMSPTYLRGILTLLSNGEERLLAAVEKGRVPVYAAVAIFKGSGRGQHQDINKALADALEEGDLKPSEVAEVKRLALRRQVQGKSISRQSGGRHRVTVSSLVRTYRQQLAKQQLMVSNATLAERRLAFVAGAMTLLFRDEHFATLLQAEGLATLPEFLARQISTQEAAS